jgi:hypothetical protein
MRGVAVGLVLFLAGALASWPHFSVARGAWLGGSAFFGAALGAIAAAVVSRGEGDPLARASAVIAEDGIALLGITTAVFAAAAISGAFRDAQVLAPAAPGLVVGVAVGAQVGRSERVARITSECVLMMIPLAMLFQRNALLLRAGPVATSAMGLFVVPIAMRALGLVALGASAVAARGPRDAGPRLVYVFASLMTLAVLGAAFVMAGLFWPSALFCGVAGVAAALLCWRAGRRGGTPIGAFAGVAGAVVASVVVAERTGLSHSVPLALCLVATTIASSAGAFEALDPDGDRDYTRTVSTLVLAPVALLAVADASTDAACSRWAAMELLPASDAAVLLAKCEAAKLAAQHVDLLHPSVALGAAAGAVMVRETREDESLIMSPVRIAVAIAIAVGLRLAFGTAGPAMAALVAGALVAAWSNGARRRAAQALAALSLALAPLYA